MNIGISNIMKDSIEQGKKEGDELALMIEDVKSDKMKAIVKLKKYDDDDNFVENVLVSVDLNLSAALNVNKMYENRKKLIEKGKKTKMATELALKNAKNLAVSEIKNKKLQFKKKQFRKNRKSLWFEKFYWFITSENYLVISARDAQQNEIIIKKYMEKDDVVFHAQIQGSAFTVVKNYTKKPISPISLNETAVAALAHSKAWNLKVIHPVYWVYSHQVSKTAPTGLSLPTGSFMIYGKKNFINPFKLEMGFGLLFKVTKECKKNHIGERKIKIDQNDYDVSQKKMIAKDEMLKNSEKKDETNIGKMVSGENMDYTEVRIDKKVKKIVYKQQKVKKKDKKNEVPEKKVEEDKNKPQNNKKIKNKKRKKKMQKYLERFGDETQEENAIRMRLQGSSKNYKVEKERKNFEWNKEKTQKSPEPELPLPKKPLETPLEVELAPKIETKAPEKKTQKKEFEKKNYHKILKVGQEEEKVSEDYFDLLTSMPIEEDSILEVMSVCAPFMTLLKYKYKVKLVPGTLKRGKVLKLVLDIFKNQKNILDQEKNLIRSILDKDAILQISGPSKVQASGLVKIIKNQKKNKKKNKKKKK